MTQRYTADSITDDALDQLYDNATRGWRRGDEWKARALKAEAAIARLTAWADELDEYSQVVLKDQTAQHPVAAQIRHHLTQPQETSTP
ncbi:hypothetical protein ABZZ79_27835 [Streptomyces sp. NPDC006458]|uniref:hypothetical protein n=1 Tax=Streptomyces sp. NPDC006458 TaxID=3154302 RepID=UPI0033A52B46